MTMYDVTPAVLLHNGICVAGSVSAWLVCRKRWLAVGIGFAAGLAASFAWRTLGPAFRVAWRDLLYEPLLRGDLLLKGMHGEDVMGLIAFCLIPILLSAGALALTARLVRGIARRRDDTS
jgi:hypothetical protein